jgi:nucleoid DNA-binding protein
MNKTEIKTIERTFIKKLRDILIKPETERMYVHGLGTFLVSSRTVLPKSFNGLKKPIEVNSVRFRASRSIKRAIN